MLFPFDRTACPTEWIVRPKLTVRQWGGAGEGNGAQGTVLWGRCSGDGAQNRPAVTGAARWSGRGSVPGWMMAASASTPSTRRGPGRTKAASASTAQTGAPSGRRRRADQLPGQRHRASRSEAARCHHDEVGRCLRHVVPAPPATDRPGSSQQRAAPGGRPPCRAPSGPRRRVGRSTPARPPGPVRARPRRRPRHGAARGGRPPTGPAAARRPVARPTAPMDSSTWSRVVGSRVSTSASAAQVGQGHVDLGAVHGADGAQVLGHHQVGVELAQGASSRV